MMSDLFEDALKPGGTKCPTCGQHVQLYRRGLGSSMVRALVAIYQYFRQSDSLEWLKVPDFLLRHGIPRADEAKLVYWGLLEPFVGLRKDGSPRNGYYRITDLGRQFVEDRVRVPKYVYVYNSEVYGFSDGGRYPVQMISIIEALGRRFNYIELMSGTYTLDVDV